jgi:anti-anti-sigma factor
LKIARKIIGEIVVYELDGQFDTNTSPHVEEAINLDLDGGRFKIIFDLSKTPFVSSAGLRVVLSTNRRISLNNGSFRLCCANEVVSEILQVSGFDTFIKIGNSLEEVLNDMSESGGVDTSA